MKNDNVTTKEKKFESVYKSYADDIYRFCLYCTKDKRKAVNIAQQVFFDFYQIFEEVEPEYRLKYLLYEAKKLLDESQITGREVKKCRISGKN